MVLTINKGPPAVSGEKNLWNVQKQKWPQMVKERNTVDQVTGGEKTPSLKKFRDELKKNTIMG